MIMMLIMINKSHNETQLSSPLLSSYFFRTKIHVDHSRIHTHEHLVRYAFIHTHTSPSYSNDNHHCYCSPIRLIEKKEEFH